MAKKDEQTPDITAENAALKEQIAAKDAQQDQILEFMAELQGKIEALEAAQASAPAKAPEVNETAAALDREWVALKGEFKDLPQIDIYEQRVLQGTDANTDIRLLDEPGILVDPKGQNRKWKLRWFNFGVEGRAQRATQEGYVKVTWAELQDAESIAALDRKDEFVRVGEKGQEVLHKIPLKLFDYKKRRDAARTQGLLTSEKGLREHLANNVAALAGANGMNADQAGSLVAGKTFSVSINKQERETVTLR